MMRLSGIFKVVLIIIVFLSLPVSCRRSAGQERPQESPEANAAEKLIEPARAAGSVQGQGGSGEKITAETTSVKETGEQGRSMPEGSIVKKHNLISAFSHAVVTPEDFEIGPLLPFENSSTGINTEYRQFITSFFDSFKNRNIAENMITEENRFFLGKVFESYMEKDLIPDRIRIGKPVLQNDSLRFNIRAFMGSNSAEGEIVLVSTPAGLKIRDFNCDLLLLEKEQEEMGKRFEPETYRFNF